MTRSTSESLDLHIRVTSYSESRAAVAGGVTSFMEMPNTDPPTFTQHLLEQKYAIASNTSLANYSFYIGAANDNAGRSNENRYFKSMRIKDFHGLVNG